MHFLYSIPRLGDPSQVLELNAFKRDKNLQYFCGFSEASVGIGLKYKVSFLFYTVNRINSGIEDIMEYILLDMN